MHSSRYRGSHNKKNMIKLCLKNVEAIDVCEDHDVWSSFLLLLINKYN